MTDAEIIKGLVERDNFITSCFLQKYRPLFLNAINLIFDYSVDTDECINELYLYLMKDDAAKLKSFQGKSTLGCWLKMVVIRFFKNLRDTRKVIEDITSEPPYEKKDENGDDVYTNNAFEAKRDLERLFNLMKNKRYVQIIRLLILEDREPEDVAQMLGITVANLYNIKKRALASLAKVAINERRIYENK